MSEVEAPIPAQDPDYEDPDALPEQPAQQPEPTPKDDEVTA